MLLAALAFGVIQSTGTLTLDNGHDLVLKIAQANGDIVSMQYRGHELETTEPKHSQIASGLGHADVAVQTQGDTLIVSAQAKDLIQYYILRKGDDTLYMATYAPTLLPVGELRFVTRLDINALPHASREPDSNVGHAIEGQDVFLLPDGHTSSKFYSARRMMEDREHGVFGDGIGVYMVMGNRERSAGGPFFKDIATQHTPVTHELYNYMFSNHTQTGTYRGGLHGPYALAFTQGPAPDPDAVDFSFIEALHLTGYIPPTERGQIEGNTIVPPSDHQPLTVGLQNAQAEYWVPVDAAGHFTLTGVLAGRYTLTLYRNELEAAEQTVDIQAQHSTQINIQLQPLPDHIKWQIGEADGTPAGFRNAKLLAQMHPSDPRMQHWGPLSYTVGTSKLSDFPAVQWKDINSPTRIHFTLSAQDIKPYRLRLFVCLAQYGARPELLVNEQWHAPLPGAPNQPTSRGITRGTYRGNNTRYEFEIPASALHAGDNTLSIAVASGSENQSFLSPAIVYDSIQLVETGHD